jgi:cytochrome c-type biogenesis protein CcmF
MVIGIIATSAWQQEKIVTMEPGDTVEIAGYTLEFDGVAPGQGPNYTERVGVFSVASGGEKIAVLHPAKRQYDRPRQSTSEAGILPSWGGDLYTSLGDELDSGGYSVRVYFNPLVRLIWIGAVIMFLAGAVSLFDRRLRVGAPRRAARGRTAPVAAE